MNHKGYVYLFGLLFMFGALMADTKRKPSGRGEWIVFLTVLFGWPATLPMMLGFKLVRWVNTFVGDREKARFARK